MINEGYTKDQINLLVEKFATRSLHKAEWTHNAHLLVAIHFIKTYDFSEAICRLKSGIILLNNAFQTENTGKSGYHETLTIFWSKIVEVYISLNKDFTLEQFVNGFLNSQLADKNLPFEFYPREKLLSPEYRSVYYSPDLKEISKLTVSEILAKNKHTINTQLL